MKIPESAINAAIRTSSTYLSRSSGGRASYRERVEVILKAALPELEADFQKKLVSPEALEIARETLVSKGLSAGLAEALAAAGREAVK